MAKKVSAMSASSQEVREVRHLRLPRSSAWAINACSAMGGKLETPASRMAAFSQKVMRIGELDTFSARLTGT